MPFFLSQLGQSALGELKPMPMEFPLEILSQKNDVDRQFLEEMQLLRAIAEKVPSAIKADSVSDVYWFVVSGLRPVLDSYGKESKAAKEGLALLKTTVQDISKAFRKQYNDAVSFAFGLPNFAVGKRLCFLFYEG